MGVPAEAPREVHEHWAKVPNCADIWFLFKPLGIGPAIRVKCEAWGQMAHDSAATNAAFYHIKNKRPYWWARYVGWKEVGGPRKGNAPADFMEQYRKHWAALGR